MAEVENQSKQRGEAAEPVCRKLYLAADRKVVKLRPRGWGSGHWRAGQGGLQ